MKAIFNKMYLDGSFIDTDKELSEEKSATYDVMRIIGGKPLFLDAHIDRVNRSLAKMGYDKVVDLPNVLFDLIKVNGDETVSCNVKILAGGDYRLAMGFVESVYPNQSDYQDGVRLTAARIERSNPEVKVWHDDYKERIKELVAEKQVFEVLLINGEDLVTEGSKSNIFFIKDKTVLTPETNVLPGITRRYAELAIENAGFELSKSRISQADLENMDAAFLTGTSLHILPICCIDLFKYDSKNQVLRACMQAFSQVVNKDLSIY